MTKYDSMVEDLKDCITTMSWEHTVGYLGEKHDREWWAKEILRRQEQITREFEYAL